MDSVDQLVADQDHSMDLVVEHMVGPVDSNQHLVRKDAYPNHDLSCHLLKVDPMVDVSPEENLLEEETVVVDHWVHSDEPD